MSDDAATTAAIARQINNNAFIARLHRVGNLILYILLIIARVYYLNAGNSNV